MANNQGNQKTNAQQVKQQNRQAAQQAGAGNAEFGQSAQTDAQQVRRQNQQAEAQKGQRQS